MTTYTLKQLVHIPADTVTLEGELILPSGAQGVVAFAHGSGSSRHSPRNTFVAGVLQSTRLGTLLFDLLTRAEDTDYETRFDIALLTRRLISSHPLAPATTANYNLRHWLLRREHRRGGGATSGGAGVGYPGGGVPWGTPGPRRSRTRARAGAHVVDRRR